MVSVFGGLELEGAKSHVKGHALCGIGRRRHNRSPSL